MARVKILSTKKLEPALLVQAREKGFTIRDQAFINIRYIENETLKTQIAYLAELPLAAVFTSSHAVKAVERYLTDKVPGWNLFSLSGKTRTTILNAQRLPPIILEEADHAAALAEKIILRQPKEVVFFCGTRRREELPALLAASGIGVQEVMVYESEETPVRIGEAFDAVLFFSPSAVHSFFKENQLNDTTVCFAIGGTTRTALQTYTGNTIITCAQPAPEKMLESVYNYYQ
ncbi:MAG TPA: uroporphyrinogen-III synthase [Flavisolibacter sp.]|jgi:uroporphyrinogen-III synthase|nr:uroporphyrinogen-III synthase [Flavisolibacter sp.]